jgi:hypothetical protein
LHIKSFEFIARCFIWEMGSLIYDVRDETVKAENFLSKNLSLFYLHFYFYHFSTFILFRKLDIFKQLGLFKTQIELKLTKSLLCGF